MNSFSLILAEKLQEAQARSSSFSQRAFARRLGLSSGALSEILRGRRTPSPRLVARLADCLALSPRERRIVGLGRAAESPAELLLSADSFAAISDWVHYAILNLTLTSGFRSDPGWIAGRLGLSRKKVEEAIERLLRLGLLSAEGGRLARTHQTLRTSDGVRDLAVQRSHREDLRLAESALDEVPVAKRDFTSVTFTLNPARMARLREMIRAFNDELMEEAERSPGQEVYRISVHLFPLTKDRTTGGNA
jgi:transcriptional regulator with XRE-family HTH domain